MSGSEALKRHDFVWLSPDVGAHQLSPCLPESRVVLAEWLACQRPLVVARRPPSLDSTWHQLGLPLPPSQGKKRLGFQVDGAAIERVSTPPPLADVISTAPEHWQKPLIQLDRDLRAVDIKAGVFGSFAWQHLTGLDYMSENSDIDLLWHPLNQQQADFGAGILRQWEAAHTLTADGEILLPDGSGVCWREYAARPDRLLVKGQGCVDLQPYHHVQQQWVRNASSC